MTHKSFRYLFHQAPSHDVSLVSGPPYELALSQDALPRRLLDFANCLPRIKQGRCIRITQAPEDIFGVFVLLPNFQLTSPSWPVEAKFGPQRNHFLPSPCTCLYPLPWTLKYRLDVYCLAVGLFVLILKEISGFSLHTFPLHSQTILIARRPPVSTLTSK